MNIKSEKSYAIVGTTISGINNREMRQMYELNVRIQDVLSSHNSDCKEKKYISDDDLNLMHAILSVFTQEFADTQDSAFDNFLKKQTEDDDDD